MSEKKYTLYGKIQNYNSSSLISDFELFVNDEWIALEKVHGANFFFVTDGKTVECGKRTSLLQLNSNFFKFQTIFEEHEKKILKVFQLIKEFQPDVTKVHIYGELFGGSYPHKDVKVDENFKYVQKGLWYAPIIYFYAFDIRTDHGYLNYDKSIELFEKVELFYAKILQRGKLEDVIKFEVEEFQTTIPGLLGLPDIKENYAEGVVIKPVNPHYISGDRVIVKKKSKAFSEINLDAMQKLELKKKRKQDQKQVEIKKHSEEVLELVEILKCYVTVNRIKNLLSKIGEVKIDEINSLIGKLAKDVFTDFKIDHGDRYDKLKEEEKKVVSKHLSKECKFLITQNAAKIVKNEI
eukprot:gene789-9039_t